MRSPAPQERVRHGRHLHGLVPTILIFFETSSKLVIGPRLGPVSGPNVREMATIGGKRPPNDEAKIVTGTRALARVGERRRKAGIAF